MRENLKKTINTITDTKLTISGQKINLEKVYCAQVVTVNYFSPFKVKIY